MDVDLEGDEFDRKVREILYQTKAERMSKHDFTIELMEIVKRNQGALLITRAGSAEISKLVKDYRPGKADGPFSLEASGSMVQVVWGLPIFNSPGGAQDILKLIFDGRLR